MLNEKIIAALEAKGFKRWTKGDMDRLYINVETLGFEMKYNSRRDLYKVERDGASYRGDEAEAIKNAKIYIDVATGDIRVTTYAMGNNREILDMLETEARAIYEAAAEETEQADAENAENEANSYDGMSVAELVKAERMLKGQVEGEGSPSLIQEQYLTTRDDLSAIRFEMWKHPGEVRVPEADKKGRYAERVAKMEADAERFFSEGNAARAYKCLMQRDDYRDRLNFAQQ